MDFMRGVKVALPLAAGMWLLLCAAVYAAVHLFLLAGNGQ